MSGSIKGGIAAIRGFDYQATVILDRLIAHFDAHGAAASVRPEGLDDLDLSWRGSDGEPHTRFEQVKKPRDDEDGNRKVEPWTLAQAARELLPGTIARLAGNTHEQIWILGDAVDADLAKLAQAGRAAPTDQPALYWRVIHVLARGETLDATSLERNARDRIVRWRVPTDLPPEPDRALAQLEKRFEQVARAAGVQDTLFGHYAAACGRLHADLPSVLARTRILPYFGSEEEVELRVRNELQARYCLDPAIVEDTLFRNLRGFINDISKQPSRRFDRDEFEWELRSVWPRMLPIREPPALDSGHVFRRDLSARFTTGFSGRAVEAVGISGAGKTMLASEVFRRSRMVDPDRIVLYAEVRPGVGLRDVLAGMGFHLRRFGIEQLFALAVDRAAARDTALDRLGRALSATPRKTLLLIDLIEGTCEPDFARDVAILVSTLTSDTCRVALFGQESGLRDLTGLERARLGIETVDVRGFNLDEFAALVSQRHPNPDHGLLHDIFRRVTAGRAAGLYAKLARSLADAPSLADMRRLAAMPADEILPRAERERFGRITAGAQSAGERLVCFALPFDRHEAEEAFPLENVGMVLREMSVLGLLRSNGDSTFEMHETVRAGLETMIAPAVRRAAHEALAALYDRRGIVTASILHLEKAGKTEEARERAKTTFLRGDRWPELARFVAAHKLVTPDQAIQVVAGTTAVDGCYLLPGILRDLDGSVDVEFVFAVLRGQRKRFLSDHQWASALADVILAFDPDRLHELIVFCLGLPADLERIDATLTGLLVRSRRHGRHLGLETIALFEAGSRDTKRLLLPFLIADGRRDALRRAFAFLTSDPDSEDNRQRWFWLERSLSIRSREDVMDLLAALPDVPGHELLARRTPLLGSLAALLWPLRRPLREYCVDILEGGESDAQVKRAALRILAFLAEPRLGDLCDELARHEDDPVHGFAALAPSMAPTLIDQTRCEARLLDDQTDMKQRVVALALLTAAGADLGPYFKRLRDAGPSDLWDFLFLQSAAQAPFPAAIPLLEAHLRSPDASGPGAFLGALSVLGRLPGREAIRMLLEAIPHPVPAVRMTAALALRDRRSRAALPDLMRCYCDEDNASIAVVMATAMIASGAERVADLEGSRHSLLDLALWKCVLAGRSRDASFAPQLVAMATGPSYHWQLRRVAIAAAGRLPFESALADMLPVLRERSPLALDAHVDLHVHATLSWLLLEERPDLRRIFKRGRAEFIAFFVDFFDDPAGRPTDTLGLPTGGEIAAWLYDRLLGHGWPNEAAAPDTVIGELHIPLLQSSILRGLRRARRFDLIELELERAEHVWIAFKCVLECVRGGRSGPDVAARLAALIARSPVAGHARLGRFIDDVAGTAEQWPSPISNVPLTLETAAPKGGFVLSFQDAVLALTGDGADVDLGTKAPLVLSPLAREEFEHLVLLSEPSNDRHRYSERYLPGVTLDGDGHSVAQWQRTYSGASQPAGSWIRPALAAANRFDLPIPWHAEMLSLPFADDYVKRLIACLAAQGNADAFFTALYGSPHAFLPHIGQYASLRSVADFIDDRMIPFLSMNLSAGTDEIFEGLCAITRHIDAPSADAVLAGLFKRWTGRFDGPGRPDPDRSPYAFWRAFSHLTSHPRFGEIEDWQGGLAAIVLKPMAWYHKESVTRVLERDPRSYISIETLLWKVEDWQHFYQDEVDRLENAAEQLFPAVSNESILIRLSLPTCQSGLSKGDR